jgi:hypothetical protein
MNAIGIDLAAAERLWRQAADAQDRLDMVECALAAIGGRVGLDRNSGTPGQDRDPGRTK